MASLLEAFLLSVERAPTAPAVQDADFSLSYEQLADWARAIAEDLTALGVAAGSRIGIQLPNSSAFVAAILAVNWIGCSYVPMDPSYPTSRLRDMATAAQVERVIGSAGRGLPVATIPALAEPGPPREATVPARRTAASETYVIFTSGSTGRPKGVRITDGNVLALLNSADGLFDFRSDDVWSLFHSFSFDFSVWEMWMPLATGAAIKIVPPAARLSARRFGEFMTDMAVTVLNMVPSVFTEFSKELPIHESKLRHVIFGGEELQPLAIAAWREGRTMDLPPRVSNMYGITEATIHATHRWVTDRDLQRASGTVIGTPLPHFDWRIVDGADGDRRGGTGGEIVLGGPSISSGYVNDPELTKSRFIGWPLSASAPTHTAFRTGDVVVWDENETAFVFRGRLDDQIQLRGFRVELGEVEFVLRRCGGVRDACATTTGTGADQVLGAAVVLKDNSSWSSELERIRAELRQFLPRHLVPSVLLCLPAIPRTPAGKADRSRVQELLGAEVRKH